MAEQNSIPAQVDAVRHLIAVGIKRGSGPLLITQPMSAADRAAHELASYIRRPAKAA